VVCGACHATNRQGISLLLTGILSRIPRLQGSITNMAAAQGFRRHSCI